MELNIEAFNPTKAELAELKTKAQAITDMSPIEEIVEMRKALVKKRGEIEKFGKGLRDEANKFNKAVLARENELVEMIEPEELRLKKIEADLEERTRIEARKLALPIRMEALKQIGDSVETSEDFLLSLDDNAFVLYKAERITEWQTKQAEILAQKEREIEAEKNRIAREKEIEEEKKLAVQEAEARAKREADIRVREAEQAKVDAERKLQEEKERQEKQKRDSEEKDRAEKERMEKQKKYRDWRLSQGWNEEAKTEWKEENTGTEIVLWRKVGTYKI